MRGSGRAGRLVDSSVAVALLLVGAPVVAGASPSATPRGPLTSVACPSTTSCFAVGSYDVGSNTRPLTEHWNGVAWSVTNAPTPNDATVAMLNGVACPSTTSCFAVGKYTIGFLDRSLVEHWNGLHWSIMTSPNPGDPNSTVLNSVTCATRMSCQAVGNFVGTGEVDTLVEQWNGTHWVARPSPNPTGSQFAVLNSVACFDVTHCFAVGSYATETSADLTLTEQWNGTSWSVVASPNGPFPFASFLNGVSCPRPANCFAVGNFSAGGPGRTLVEHWNGAVWTIVASPNPNNSTDAGLLGSSCAATTSCFAVGDFGTTGNGTRPLQEQWNASHWTITPSPNPAASGQNVLAGVSCPSATSCFAVGDTAAGPTEKSLAEHWDGASWTITLG
jgi:hypothetical protein